MSLDFGERVRIAYKKLKASVYFDKTQLPLRDRLVAYESQGEDQLKFLAAKLTGLDSDWDVFQEEVLSTVSAFVFPKSLNRRYFFEKIEKSCFLGDYYNCLDCNNFHILFLC